VPQPQDGIFHEGLPSQRHLEFSLYDQADLPRLVTTLAALAESELARASVVVGLGAQHAAALGGVGPVTLASHQHFPETPADAWVWVQGSAPDVTFDAARAAHGHLRPIASLLREVDGFAYHDSRDLSGFIEGTENPDGVEARQVALNETGLLAGCSFALVQTWVHDLAALEARSLEEQEAIIGRTKANSVELESKLATAHIERVVIDDGDRELEVYRRSTPYGDSTLHGLLFVGLCADAGVLDRMMGRMAGEEDGQQDALFGFTTATSSALYLVPSLEHLARAS
jgi:putative iron-dependent peroxidase